MLSQACKLKWTTEQSDFDAILSEAEMIRAFQPKFNFRLKDDRSPLYIVFTKETFPRVLTARKSDLGSYKSIKKVFGPYISTYQTRKVLNLLRRAFPFCNASKFQKKRKKACFYRHLGLCPGVCTEEISEKDYSKIIDNLQLFLKGEKPKILKDLEKKMKQAADNLQFEKAQEIKNQIQAIHNLSKTPSPISWEESLELTDSQLHRDRLILYKTLAPIFAASKIRPPKNPFRRIEAFDVSNISGKFATGSMVVFTQGKPNPSEYKRFRIRLSSEEPNDPYMLAEIISRRIKHREWKLPELIVVDGGKTQVKAAKKALASFGLHHRIPVIGIAKRFENLIIHKNVFHVLNLPKSSPALKLIMRTRDEAHRFAKGYHRVLRQKELTT